MQERKTLAFRALADLWTQDEHVCAGPNWTSTRRVAVTSRRMQRSRARTWGRAAWLETLTLAEWHPPHTGGYPSLWPERVPVRVKGMDVCESYITAR